MMASYLKLQNPSKDKIFTQFDMNWYDVTFTVITKFKFGLISSLFISCVLLTYMIQVNRYFRIDQEFYIYSVYQEIKDARKSTPPISYNFTEKILLMDWTTFFGSPLTTTQRLHNCPQYNCELTNDRTKLEQSRAVIFHIRNFNLNDLPVNRSSNQYYVFFLAESPHHTYLNYHAVESYFNLTMTYRFDSNFILSYGDVLPDKNNIPLDDDHLADMVRNKTKLVAWFASNCNTPSKREFLVSELKKHVPVDIYGSCGPLQCPRSGQEDCNERLSQHYKFYLSFENSICKDYITEKFYERISSMIVPIVLRRQLYDHLQMPPNSFIAVDDFCTVQDLAEYLKYLDQNATAYMEYFKWRRSFDQENFTKIFYANDQERNEFCGLCKFLHRTEQSKPIEPIVLKDPKKWWYDDAQCQTTFVQEFLHRKRQTISEHAFNRC